MFSQPLINEMIHNNSSPKIPSKCKHTFRMIIARASERREARFAVVCLAPVFNFVFLSLSYKFLKQANVRTVSRITHLDDEQIENTSSRWAAFWWRFSSTYIFLFALWPKKYFLISVVCLTICVSPSSDNRLVNSDMTHYDSGISCPVLSRPT